MYRPIWFLSFLLVIQFLQAQSPPLDPEEVLYTYQGESLRYKHLIAYMRLEMEGENPALLQDQSYIESLTEEAIEAFREAPELFIADMEAHYEAMSDANPAVTSPKETESPPGALSGTGSWKQLLSGSVLYTTATQHHAGGTVQSSQYMHLCPEGTAYFYQNSGGGGGALTAHQQLEYTGSSWWDVTEEQGNAYLKITLEGQTGFLPMRRVNQQIFIEGLGYLDIQPQAAQCR